MRPYKQHANVIFLERENTIKNKKDIKCLK